MRLDAYLFSTKKFSSRTKSAEAIEKGFVCVNGKTVLKPSQNVSDNDVIAVCESNEFVSNGGYKLEKALSDFSVDVNGLVFADVGASTGGFTDCLLQNGAKQVFAIDVGESLLDESLKNDVRVIEMENVNARYLQASDFPCGLDGIVADVSFISPVISAILQEGTDAFTLIKPQFECEKQGIGKSGIVKKTEHKKIVKKVLVFAAESGLEPLEITNAPIKKGKNIEYVLHLKKNDATDLQNTISKARNERILNEIDRILKTDTENK